MTEAASQLTGVAQKEDIEKASMRTKWVQSTSSSQELND